MVKNKFFVIMKKRPAKNSASFFLLVGLGLAPTFLKVEIICKCMMFNCGGERTFSSPKLTKKLLLSTIDKKRTNAISSMGIQSIFDKLNFHLELKISFFNDMAK